MRPLSFAALLVVLAPLAAAQPLATGPSPDPAQEYAYYGIAVQGSEDQSMDWPGEDDRYCDIIPCVCLDVETPFLATLVLVTGGPGDELALSTTAGTGVATIGQPVTLATISANSCVPPYFFVAGTSVADHSLYRVDIDCPDATPMDPVPFYC